MTLAGLRELAASTNLPMHPLLIGQPRNTKIVCTVGPASCSLDQIRGLIAAGANVFRLNFSHGDHTWHDAVLEHIRRASSDLRLPVAVLQDLCGPKIRLSQVLRPEHVVVPGDLLRISTDSYLSGMSPSARTQHCDITSTYPSLLDDVQPGHRILLDDGRVELLVQEKVRGALVARVLRGGAIQPGKGMNMPGVTLSAASVTSKDWHDLEWGISRGVDFVALSFVRHPSDLVAVHQRLEAAGSLIRLIAKIERPEAIAHIEAILDLADGLMVARGDLGVETELAQVPLLQKLLIQRCQQLGKPVITATQMLESMVHDSSPTRAEVSDVANAIYDGSDAIMLSAETATGRFPQEAVSVLNKVALVTEADVSGRRPSVALGTLENSAAVAIAEGAASTAIRLRARRVVVYSQSGLTARLMARHRLPMPVMAVTNHEVTYRQMSLLYGVNPVLMPHVVDLPQLLKEVDQLAHHQGWGQPGEALVIVSALDGRDGNTDTLHVHRLGD